MKGKIKQEPKNFYEFIEQGGEIEVWYNAGGDQVNDYSIKLYKDKKVVIEYGDYTIMDVLLEIAGKEIYEASGDEYNGETVTVTISKNEKEINCLTDVDSEYRKGVRDTFDVYSEFEENVKMCEGVIDYMYNTLMDKRVKPTKFISSDKEEILLPFNITSVYIESLSRVINNKPSSIQQTILNDSADRIPSVRSENDNATDVYDFLQTPINDTSEADSVEIDMELDLKDDILCFDIERIGNDIENETFERTYSVNSDPEEYQEVVNKLKEIEL